MLDSFTTKNNNIISDIVKLLDVKTNELNHQFSLGNLLISDSLISSIYIAFKKVHIESEKQNGELVSKSLNISKNDIIEHIKASSHINKYDPFEIFLNNNRADSTFEIDKLMNIFENYVDNFAAKKFIDFSLGVIQNYISDIKYERIMVFYSKKQGTGKTKFLTDVLIKEFNKFVTPVNWDLITDNKDEQLKMATNIILYDDEFNFKKSKADIRRLKTVSSTKLIDSRLPYQQFSSKFERKCSFWINTNDDEILSPFEENRRLMIIKIPDVSWNDNSLIKSLKENIDFNKYWGEIYNLFLKEDYAKLGYTISDDEIRNSQNQYVCGNIELETISEIYTPHRTDTNTILEYVNYTKLFDLIDENTNSYEKRTNFRRSNLKAVLENNRFNFYKQKNIGSANLKNVFEMYRNPKLF